MAQHGLLYGLMFAGAVTAGAMALVLVFYILVAVAQWMIFTKAGEAGWKGLIPIYNIYTLYRLTWKTSMFWALMVLELISAFIQKGDYGVLLSLVGGICSLAGLVIAIIGMNKLSKSFGHGAGFTVGLVLLCPIFLLILGFGSSQYMGNLSWPNQVRF